MERVRTAFNNMVRGGRYSRFSLQPERDGVQHVEVRLSEDTLDDTTEVNGQPAAGYPSYQPHPATKRRHQYFYMALGTLLIFLIGLLIGFVSHSKPQQQPISCTTSGAVQSSVENPPVPAEAPKPSMDWRDITRLLSERLNAQTLTKALSDIDVASRTAGSSEDQLLVNRILLQFKQQEMKPWMGINNVQLPIQDSNQPNTVRFGKEVFHPKGYLAYSAKGRVQGKVVYGNYAGPKDFSLLEDKRVAVAGSVMLIRASPQISFAQQVANAASKGAAAVLVYPDPQEYKYNDDTELFGHVHLGSGDPNTPGFPSIKHTRFLSTRSSGLPSIPAQTLTASMAAAILRDIGGPEVEAHSGFTGLLSGVTYRLGGSVNATVEINNVQVDRELHNVFGVIKGFVDPDRYVIIGAQRDSWGRGYARSTVGTAVLMELARAVYEMVEKDEFRPRRSIVFASWSAGEYGNVGATEWLEGYLPSLAHKAFTYISLDGVVMGKGSFMASASPLLRGLIEKTIKDVRSPTEPGTVYDTLEGKDWLRPMALDDPAYPFLTSSGIPSMSFHIITKGEEAYSYYGTGLDNKDHLDYSTGQKTPETAIAAATLAGRMVLRLVHDHRLPLDLSRNVEAIDEPVSKLVRHIAQLTKDGTLSNVSYTWIASAGGSYSKATADLNTAFLNTDFNDAEACRIINERIMVAEQCLLSPYVTPQDTPFRHLLAGRGAHTLASLLETSDMEHFKVQLALATWTLQSCADSMAGQIWEVDNEM
ncbi:transferrin receptor 1b [Gadus macrocephalus]|uniref:transferrin receptor 1b n=1 Tax=Gadus macrocephalus TaxID=80720 RepID=UPI0028CBC0D4|nr:transferrin receptor 1b [Gadus macrocephalus]